MKFDTYKDSYRQEVQKALELTGVNIDSCAEAKATAILEVCRRHVGNPEGLEALDLGCGIGVTDRFLASSFRGLWGVDVSAECIEVAAGQNPNVHYQAYQGGTLPFSDGRFDVVFVICVMHHVKPNDWPAFVAEMRRVTRPGGITVVFEHNPFNPLTRLVVSRCAFDADAVLLSCRRTKSLLVRAGIEVVEGRYILFFPFRSKITHTIERSIGWLPLGGQYFVVGRVGNRLPQPVLGKVA